MAKADLTAARLRELFQYSEDTGQFIRLIGVRGMGGHVGAICGSPDRKGHIYMCVAGARYAAHRLAWLYVKGVWPSDQIDHINGEKADNRICNLRLATTATNTQNQRRARSDSLSGVLGVSAKGNRFRAGIKIDGKQTFLGSFATSDEAHAAYLAAKRSHHAGCTI